MNRIVKVFHLPYPEKLIFFQAVKLLTTWRIRLNSQDFKAVVQLNGIESKRLFASRTANIPPETFSAFLNAAGKVIPFTTCLSKALAGQILFSLYGHKTMLHIGVEKKSAGNLKAHAWLTLNGKLLIGYVDDIDNYWELPPLPDI